MAASVLRTPLADRDQVINGALILPDYAILVVNLHLIALERLPALARRELNAL